MLIRLLLLFTIVPIVELFILIKIGTLIGAAATILIVLATGIAGALLTRRHGFSVWRKIQERMERGLFPAEELMDGLLILIAGVVLITPGIITDVFGFSLLFPVTRQLYKRLLKKRFAGMMQSGTYKASDVFYGQRTRRVNPETGEPEDREEL